MKSSPMVFTLYSLLLGGLVFAWGFASGKNQYFPYDLLVERPAADIISQRIGSNARANIRAEHIEWAQEILKGGYFLHFRHAQREKWTDVTGFDALELSRGFAAENESFSRATCLTERGQEEAKLIKSVFKLVDLKVHEVFSSPSCRARMTSDLAFGGSDYISNALLHRTAMMEHQHEHAAQKLKEIFLKAELIAGHNTIFSGHGGTLGFDKDILFAEPAPKILDERQEGGFAVIERSESKLYVRHIFPSFSDFVNNLVELDVTAVSEIRTRHKEPD